MTEADLQQIESELGVVLPSAYRKAVLEYPIPAFRGNADTPIWDNAKRILKENDELRGGSAGGVKPWPAHMFAMGHGGDGCPYALDLSDPGAVWWAEKRHLDSPNTYKLPDPSRRGSPRSSQVFGPIWKRTTSTQMERRTSGPGADVPHGP